MFGVYRLDLVQDEVALVAQDSGRLPVLFGQQVEPLGQSVHHGQDDGPEEAQDVQDPLNHLPVTCSTQRGRRAG